MDSIRLKNIRSLQDTKEIKLNPITLLVGKNGSGKSTFARFFMLLRQSIESRTKGPLLWYGDYVDFGSFEESRNKHSNDESISFAFSIPLPKARSERNNFISPWDLQLLNDSLAYVDFTIKCTKESKTYIHCLKIRINDDVIVLMMDKNLKLNNFMVNDFDVLKSGSTYEIIEDSSIIPFIKSSSPHKIEKKQHIFFPFTYRDSNIIDSITDDLKSNFCDGRVHREKIEQFACGLQYGDKESFTKHIKSTKALGTVYTRKINKTNSDNKTIENLRSKVLASMVTNISIHLSEYIQESAKSMYYTKPVRAGIVRFYREQDLSVAEIDPEGRNLPMFLRNLSEMDRKDFKKWTLETLGFEVKAHSRHGQIALYLTEEGCTQEYNLADMGFGFSQILPIVAQLWIIVKKSKKSRRYNLPKILSIEQPELHLHPNHQAKVADMFVSAIHLAQQLNVDLRLVIETHSETIINRIGNLIYQQKLKKDDASVILFEKRHADKSTEVSVSGYDSEGCLQDWPYGFFQPEEG